MTRYTLHKFRKWLSNTWSVLCNHKNKIIHSSVLACITAASSAKRGERGILRETSAKRETKGGFALVSRFAQNAAFAHTMYVPLAHKALYAGYSVPVWGLLLITGQDELTGSMASMVTYNSQNSSFGVNLDQAKRNLVPVTENFGLSKVEFAE